LPEDAYDPDEYFWWKILNLIPLDTRWPVKLVIFVSALFSLSGFGLLMETVFPRCTEEGCVLLRNLFYWNWLNAVIYIGVALMMLRGFVRRMYAWIENQAFADDDAVREKQKKLMTEGLRRGLGSISIVAALGVVAIRRFVILIFRPDWYTMVEPAYFGWYIGGEVLVLFATVYTFWLLILVSFLVFKILRSAAVEIEDPFSYKEVYEDVVKLANNQMVVTSALVGLFLAGITYWASIVKAAVSAMLLAGVAAVGTALVFLLNAYAIHAGIELSKSKKIHEIRKEAGAVEARELRISYHMQVSSWELGFGFGKTFLISLLSSEVVALSSTAIEQIAKALTHFT
jgi:hypothetical protein